MNSPLGVSDAVSLVALIVSLYATLKTNQFNNRQKSVIESQEKLNVLLLEKEASDLAVEKQANLGASIIKLGKSQYRLKVWNKGKSIAHNVSIELPDGNDILDEREIKEIFPLEVLDVHQSVELVAFVHMGTKSKHSVRLVWKDQHNDRNEKLVYVTI